RAKIRQLVSKWTGEYQLTLDSVFDDMIGRCRELKLRAVGSERQLRMEFIVLLTAKTVHSLYSPSRRQCLALCSTFAFFRSCIRNWCLRIRSRGIPNRKSTSGRPNTTW